MGMYIGGELCPILLCNNGCEDVNHLFFMCPFADSNWKVITLRNGCIEVLIIGNLKVEEL